MKNYCILNATNEPRVELHDKLGLTGAEVSINNIPAGACVPFVHHHKENEEIYFIFEGKGKMIIDEEAVLLKKGDFIRVSPNAKRQMFAANDMGISFICIQTKQNSLDAYTKTDAVLD